MPLAAILRLQAERLPTAPSGPDLTRYFLVCGGLLLIVLLLTVVFRRAFGRALAARAARRSLRIVDVLPLGGSKRLVVVHCYDRVFLVGQGEKELHPIAELDSEATLGQAARAPTAAGAPAVPEAFARALEQAAGGEVQPAPRRPVLERGRGILG